MTTEDFGPVRVIGFSYSGPNDQGQIPKFWESVIPRFHEIPMTENAASFGICRCIEGAPAGQFEYIAGAAAQQGVPVPEGLVEVLLPAGPYLVKRIESLSEIHTAWESLMGEIKLHSEWQPYCGPDGCDCATAPCFELYPPDFPQNPELFIYVPVKSAKE